MGWMIIIGFSLLVLACVVVWLFVIWSNNRQD